MEVCSPMRFRAFLHDLALLRLSYGPDAAASLFTSRAIEA